MRRALRFSVSELLFVKVMERRRLLGTTVKCTVDAL